MATINVGGKQIPLVIPKTDKSLTTIQPGGRYGPAITGGQYKNIYSVSRKKGSDSGTNDLFGYSSTISGSYAAIGAISQAGKGAVYVFENQNNSWSEVQKLSAADNSSNDYFGQAVAMSGNWLAIGADGGYFDAQDKGTVYMFENQNGTWVEVQKLRPSVTESLSDFGVSIALEGNTLVVGSQYADSPVDSGRVYVFENQNGTWSETQALSASAVAANSAFGNSVSIYGNHIAVGAPKEDTLGSDVGMVYMFEKQNGTWTETQNFKSADASSPDNFGGSVNLHVNTLVVGAPNDSFNGLGQAGSAYVFEKQNGTWTEIQKLTASDAASDVEFGTDVAMDGDFIVVGAPGEDSVRTNSGAAYMFEKQNGTWTEISKYKGTSVNNASQFSKYSLSLKEGSLLVGAPNDSFYGTDSGVSYFFVFQQ